MKNQEQIRRKPGTDDELDPGSKKRNPGTDDELDPSASMDPEEDVSDEEVVDEPAS